MGGPDKWNPDYRINREIVLDSGTSPCITQCPAHIPIQGYIKLASQGRYTEALELIKKKKILSQQYVDGYVLGLVNQYVLGGEM